MRVKADKDEPCHEKNADLWAQAKFWHGSYGPSAAWKPRFRCEPATPLSLRHRATGKARRGVAQIPSGARHAGLGCRPYPWLESATTVKRAWRNMRKRRGRRHWPAPCMLARAFAGPDGDPS
jgi:hypothetical protein